MSSAMDLFFYIINSIGFVFDDLTIAGIPMASVFVGTIGIGGAIDLLKKKGDNL